VLPGLAQQNHPSRCERIRRRLERNRKFADSPLEEDGFELRRDKRRVSKRPPISKCSSLSPLQRPARRPNVFPAQQAGLVDDFPARGATVLAWNNSALFSASRSDLLLAGRPSRTAAFAARSEDLGGNRHCRLDDQPGRHTSTQRGLRPERSTCGEQGSGNSCRRDDRFNSARNYRQGDRDRRS
jgi:hypothetical protein